MRFIPRFRRIFRLSAFLSDPESDLEDELQFHFRETEEELLASGLSRSEAREESRRRFGDLGRYRTELNQIDRKTATRSRRLAILEAMSQDLAYTLRGMRRAPGFTVAVALTLALGIGANATMFGVIDRLLLSPPAHVVDADGVVRLQIHRVSPFTGEPAVMQVMTFPDYMDFTSAGTLSSVAAFGSETVILGRGDDAIRVEALFGTASFYPLLGVSPALGRFPSELEDTPNSAEVVVLSHGLWKTRYGGSREVIGRTLSIGDGMYTVVGVAPEGFNGVDLDPVDLFLPIHAYTVQSDTDRWIDGRGYWWIRAVARVSPSSSRVAATEEATALHLNGRRDLIEEGRYQEDARIVLGSIKAALGPHAPGEIQVARWLAGVTLIVLLIACANVANLLLARGARRRRELGIRGALGISRRRLMGQLLLESCILALFGGTLGLAVAYWGGELMRAVFLPSVAWPSSPVDGRVLLFTLALAGGTGLLAGIAPAFRGSRSGVVEALKEGGRGGTRRTSGGQSVLLIVQAALSVVLLVGAGLFVRSLGQVNSLDLGLEPDGLVLATMELDGDWEPEAVLALGQRGLDRIEPLPGVLSASLSSGIPFWSMSAFEFFVPELDSIPAPRGMGPFVTASSPGHLSTLGIQLKEGRLFTEQEASAGARVAVVTENMARGLWGSESAIGRCFMVQDRESSCWEVIGIVEDSRLSGVTEDEPWQYFIPFGDPSLELGMNSRAMFVRTRGDPREVLAPIRHELRNLDPSVRFAHVRLHRDLIDPEIRAWKLGATMFTLFGVLALLVAMVGLYSVMAFNVARRTRELGVRSAMGASRGRLLGMVLRQAVGVAGVGVAVGMGAALMASNSLGPLLFDTSPRDPIVLGGVAISLLVVSLLASAFPAWTAARTDPMGALRTE